MWRSWWCSHSAKVRPIAVDSCLGLIVYVPVPLFVVAFCLSVRLSHSSLPLSFEHNFRTFFFLSLIYLRHSPHSSISSIKFRVLFLWQSFHQSRWPCVPGAVNSWLITSANRCFKVLCWPCQDCELFSMHDAEASRQFHFLFTLQWIKSHWGGFRPFNGCI